MAEYRFSNDGSIIRAKDSATIPFDAANRDYAGYLEWKKAGGIPDPYVPLPPTAEEMRAETFKVDASRVDIMTRLKTATPVQIDTYVDGINTLAKMQGLMKAVLKAIALDARS